LPWPSASSRTSVRQIAASGAVPTGTSWSCSQTSSAPVVVGSICPTASEGAVAVFAVQPAVRQRVGALAAIAVVSGTLRLTPEKLSSQ
jgi:hypothetical protein